MLAILRKPMCMYRLKEVVLRVYNRSRERNIQY
jgi:hypothetical protein